MYVKELMLGDSYYVEAPNGTRVYLGVLIEKRIIDPNNDSECEYVFSQRISLDEPEENYIICTVSENDEDALDIVHTDIALPELEKPRHVNRRILSNDNTSPTYYRLKEFFLSGNDVLSLEPVQVYEYVW
jgi:hypothetical protein